MSIITGLAAEAFSDFADDFEDATLTVPGQKLPDGQGGWSDWSTVSHACRALVTDYDAFRRTSLGIPASDRLVLILGGSLPAGVVPSAGQQITAPDPAKGLALTTFEIIGKTGDPAGALYEVQAR